MKIMEPRRSSIHAWLWVLHIITGLGLGVYVVIHMFDVGLVIVGRDAYNFLAEHMETGPFSVVVTIVLWLVGIALLIHTLNGFRIASKPYGTPAKLFRHLVGTKHKGTWYWILQVMTGSALVAFLAIHYFSIHGLDAGIITFEKSLGRVHNPWFMLLYVVTLAVLLYHTLNGFRSVMVKLGYTASVAKEKKLTKVLCGLGVAFFVIGVVAIIRFITMA